MQWWDLRPLLDQGLTNFLALNAPSVDLTPYQVLSNVSIFALPPPCIIILEYNFTFVESVMISFLRADGLAELPHRWWKGTNPLISYNFHTSVRSLLSQVTGVWLEWSCSSVFLLPPAPWSTSSSTSYTWTTSSQRRPSRCSRDSLSTPTPSSSSTVLIQAKRVPWTVSME